MATIEDYCSGRILVSIRRAHGALGVTRLPVLGRFVSRYLEERMIPYGTRPITREETVRIIEGCRTCAAGPRVCQPLFPESAGSESVFLDELAEGMVRAGKATPVSKEAAVLVLDRYPQNPLLLSKVAGRYREICRSDPRTCIWWTMRRDGLDVNVRTEPAHGRDAMNK